VRYGCENFQDCPEVFISDCTRTLHYVIPCNKGFCTCWKEEAGGEGGGGGGGEEEEEEELGVISQESRTVEDRVNEC